MTCPRCNIELQRVDSGGLELDLCRKCEGSWYDWSELDRAFGMTDKDLLATLSRATTGVDLDPLINCPRCAVQLERGRYLQDCPVIVDKCNEHGVWLDGGELKSLRDYMALQVTPDEGWFGSVMRRLFGR